MGKAYLAIAIALVMAWGWSLRATADPARQLPPASPAGVAADADSEDQPVAVQPAGEKAMSYYRSGNRLWLYNQVWGLLLPALFLFTGFSARLRDLARKIGRRWFLTIGAYFLFFSVIIFLIDLPLSYYQEFVRQHAYGLSNQTFAKWLGDSFRSLGVGAIGGFLFLWIPYLLLKRSPKRWWFYTGLVAVPFLLLVMLVSPIWIDPLFNNFGPMKDKALEDRILELAHRAGIEGSRVYEVDKSVDTKAVNAYVTGFMNTKRVVLWDTILAKLNEKELLVVVGHEMGHYVLGHVVKGILFYSILIMATLYGVHRSSGALLSRFRRRFGFEQLSDVASLPLIVLLFLIASLVVTPVALGFSRYQEHEADRFALEITRTNHSAAMAFVKLQQENLSNPRPGRLYQVWRASHPAIGERIGFCNAYQPWKSGEPLKYGRYFKP